MCTADSPVPNTKTAAMVRRATARALAAVADIDPASGELIDGAAGYEVQFLRAFVRTGGLILLGDWWVHSPATVAAVASAVEQALQHGSGADNAAAAFMQSDAGSAASKTVEREAITEVFHTEINRAHGEAYMAGAADAPGFAGFKFSLSPPHPRPDVCDLLATQNLYGLGNGVYPDRASTPWPPHPGALGFVVAVFNEQVTDPDRTGRETSLAALGRLDQDQRKGVLGQTKAKYFDRGWLRGWMIRSPLAAVQRRLVRQGVLGIDDLEADPDPCGNDDDDDDAPDARGYDKFEEIRLIRQFVDKPGVFQWDAKEDQGEFYGSYVRALLRRLLDLNYLRLATVAECLALRFTVGQLRAECKSRALAVDGSKIEMADRLCGADPQWTSSEARLVAVAVTDTGRSFLKRLTSGGYYAEDIAW